MRWRLKMSVGHTHHETDRQVIMSRFSSPRVGRVVAGVQVATLAAVGLAMSTAGPAMAVTCVGYGCDGQDPNVSGCSSGANTTSYAYLRDPNNNVVGLLELRYSPTCGTNWGRVTSYIGSKNMFTDVTRQTDGRRFADVGVYTVVWSRMVYAYNITACATGDMQLSSTTWTNMPRVCG